MLKELDGYNWECAFEYAGGKGSGYGSASISAALPNDDVSLSHFGREDVAEIIAFDQGEHDERNWVVVGKLNDGRFFFLDAGCDYTGWD